ncbi:MAG: hypothetical protein IT342_01225 [Candidatus Melainabacteria bacterium]|nr:hypothetical protein [Candidatus Melainabacteria bacterium]
MVHGIVIKQHAGNLVITTVVRASRNGIARFEAQADVIEQKQGKVIIDDSALTEGDFVVSIMTAKNSTTGAVVREKTTSIFPVGVQPVEASTITLPSGTVVDKDAGVQVV